MEPSLAPRMEPSDENEDHSHAKPFTLDAGNDEEENEQAFVAEEPGKDNETSDGEFESYIPFVQIPFADADHSSEITIPEKARGLTNLSRINSRTERVEAWR